MKNVIGRVIGTLAVGQHQQGSMAEDSPAINRNKKIK